MLAEPNRGASRKQFPIINCVSRSPLGQSARVVRSADQVHVDAAARDFRQRVFEVGGQGGVAESLIEKPGWEFRVYAVRAAWASGPRKRGIPNPVPRGSRDF